MKRMGILAITLCCVCAVAGAADYQWDNTNTSGDWSLRELSPIVVHFSCDVWGWPHSLDHGSAKIR